MTGIPGYDTYWHGSPPEEPEPRERCCMCGYKVWEYQRFGEDVVCPECKAEYLRGQAGDYIEEYIELHPEYYLEWWWPNLPRAERLAVIRAHWQARRRIEEICKESDLPQDKVDFCLEQDGFLGYVEEQLR